MSAEAWLDDAREMCAPRFERCHVGDEVVFGVSALVDDGIRPDIAHVVVTGDLCPVSAPDLERLLDSLVDDGITEIHVDLSKLDFCTSHGVEVLERTRRRVEDRGGSLQLVAAHGVVRRVLELTGTEAGHGVEQSP